MRNKTWNGTTVRANMFSSPKCTKPSSAKAFIRPSTIRCLIQFEIEEPEKNIKTVSRFPGLPLPFQELLYFFQKSDLRNWEATTVEPGTEDWEKHQAWGRLSPTPKSKDWRQDLLGQPWTTAWGAHSKLVSQDAEYRDIFFLNAPGLRKRPKTDKIIGFSKRDLFSIFFDFFSTQGHFIEKRKISLYSASHDTSLEYPHHILSKKYIFDPLEGGAHILKAFSYHLILRKKIF